MIKIDEIKEVFAQQMKNEFDNPSISPFVGNWQKGVDLLFEAIELTDFRKALIKDFEAVLISKKGNYDALSKFAFHLEKYLKFIGRCTGILEYQQDLSLLPIIKKLRLLSYQENLGYPYLERRKLPDFEGKSEFLAHLCRTHCTRNETTHKEQRPNWLNNDLAILQSRNSVMVTFLYATLKHYDALKNAIEKMRVDNETNIQPYQEDIVSYLKNVICDFEKWQKRMAITEKITLRVYEDLVDESERKMREGTVESLRNSISEKQMMILGGAGMGKTTTLKYLVHADAKKRLKNPKLNNIPVYLELKYFTGEETLESGILRDFPLLPEKTRLLLKNGKINLFLDGLNEVIDSNKQKLILEIQGFLNHYPKVRLLISSREPKRFEIEEGLMPAFYFKKMDRAQIVEFLEKNADSETRNIIQAKMESNPKFIKRLHVPLMLKIMVDVVRQYRVPPDSEPEMMEKFFQHIYARESEKDENFNDIEFDGLMSHLAYKIEENQKGKEKKNVAIERDTVVGILGGARGFPNADFSYFLKLAVELNILEKTNNRLNFAYDQYFHYFSAKGLEQAIFAS